ncbi:winged helix-turn-helix domain-containing protein [Planococcus massiliensis]|uniref:winged helix-turn-helix domain-containing protein n=1 Tax=Planococcus massiliensis TaxID=1499687 RepID=UPI001F2BCB73|nr:helix-turn-helix domain-containing protein [Planococcus massiliensis]
MKILSYLYKNKGKIVSINDLIDFMWNSNAFIDDNNLSLNVTGLRKNWAYKRTLKQDADSDTSCHEPKRIHQR